VSYNTNGSIEPISLDQIGSENVSDSLPIPVNAPSRALSVEHLDAIAAMSKASRADSTRRTYQAAWQQYSSWCAEHGRCPMPADRETIQAWLWDLSKTLKVSTIEKLLAVVANAHRLADHSFDRKRLVGLVLDGIKRTKGTAKRQARAITLSDIRQAVDKLPATLAGQRDRALLLVGFFGAMRRSEIVGLDAQATLTDGASGHVQIAAEGLLIHLARSKTDQQGAGQKFAIPRRRDDLCPARALENWINAAGISSGAIFRTINKVDSVGPRLSAQSVRLIVQRHLDADDTAHGLRAGFITEGARRGASDRELMKTSRHKNTEQLGGYIRDANVWEGTAHKRMEDNS
jgi:integrase